jgi:hypothetical protein
MATTMYFEEEIRDQGGKAQMMVEIGRSSYYSEDSIYLNVDGKFVIETVEAPSNSGSFERYKTFILFIV